MAQFTINVQARGDFVHIEPAVAYATIIHNEPSNEIQSDVYQKIPFEDLVRNIVTLADYPALASLKQAIPIQNPNSLGFVKFSLESLYFKGMLGDTEQLSDYDGKFICTTDGAGNYSPLQFGVEYPISVIKRGLFLHASGYLPLNRAVIGNIVLKYNFRYPEQSTIDMNNNPFTLNIQFGSTIKSNSNGFEGLEFPMVQIITLKEGDLPYNVPVFGEYYANGNNIPTYTKAGLSSTTTANIDGLSFTSNYVNQSYISTVRQPVAGNTSGTSSGNYMPLRIQGTLANGINKTTKFTFNGTLSSAFLGGGDPIIFTLTKYLTVVENSAYQPIT